MVHYNTETGKLEGNDPIVEIGQKLEKLLSQGEPLFRSNRLVLEEMCTNIHRLSRSLDFDLGMSGERKYGCAREVSELEKKRQQKYTLLQELVGVSKDSIAYQENALKQGDAPFHEDLVIGKLVSGLDQEVTLQQKEIKSLQLGVEKLKEYLERGSLFVRFLGYLEQQGRELVQKSPEIDGPTYDRLVSQLRAECQVYKTDPYSYIEKREQEFRTRLKSISETRAEVPTGTIH